MPSSERFAQGQTTARICAILEGVARQTRVAEVRIGLGYTAVRLDNDRTGVAYTFREAAQGGCSVFHGRRPLAGTPAAELLPLLESTDPIEAAVGLACANALANQPGAPFQSGDILEQLQLEPDDRVGMVGHFAPLVGPLQQRVQSLTVFEDIPEPRGLLRPAAEAGEILPGCQVALITGTAIINHTIDALLDAARECREVVILGASTPLLPEAFTATGVSLLSGVVVTQPAEVLQIVSEGGGMRQFKSSVDKVNLMVDGEARR